MSIATTTLYGDGNFFWRSSAQGGVYESTAYTARLDWNTAYTAPTPTGEALFAPTAAVAYPHTLFTGVADGFWVYRVWLDGHLMGTYTFVDQEFSIPIPFSNIEVVSMGTGIPVEGVPEPLCGHGHHGHHGGGDCPSPAGAAVLLLGALFAPRKRSRA